MRRIAMKLYSMVGNREGTNKEFLSTICIIFIILYKKGQWNVLKKKLLVLSKV